jgi:hypothetical protein
MESGYLYQIHIIVVKRLRREKIKMLDRNIANLGRATITLKKISKQQSEELQNLEGCL